MDQTLSTMLMFGALLVGGYFLLIRPQQKRAKEQQDMVAKLGEGSRVMLTSGVFCTVRHMGTKQAIVEISPGVDLTIARAAIVREVAPDEEEFEYGDEVPDDLQDLVPDEDAWKPESGDHDPTPSADEPPATPDSGADRR